MIKHKLNDTKECQVTERFETDCTGTLFYCNCMGSLAAFAAQHTFAGCAACGRGRSGADSFSVQLKDPGVMTAKREERSLLWTEISQYQYRQRKKDCRGFMTGISSMITAESEQWSISRVLKTHQTVENALRIVENLEHRAGKDAEGKTGDGVGILPSDFPQIFQKGGGGMRHCPWKGKRIRRRHVFLPSG